MGSDFVSNVQRLSNFRVCIKSNTTDATSGAETSYKCSFIPNVIVSWNLLDVDTQNQHSRLMFKKQIISNISVPPPPPILSWIQENTTYSIVNLET